MEICVLFFLYLLHLFFKFKHQNRGAETLAVHRVDRPPKRPIFEIYLKETVEKGNNGSLELSFDSQIWESVEGLFTGSYINANGEKV